MLREASNPERVTTTKVYALRCSVAVTTRVIYFYFLWRLNLKGYIKVEMSFEISALNPTEMMKRSAVLFMYAVRAFFYKNDEIFDQIAWRLSRHPLNMRRYSQVVTATD